MKTLLLFMLLLPLFSTAQNDSIIPFVDGKIQFETIIEVKNKNAKELYTSVKLMISEIYKSGKTVTDVADDEGLFIVVKGITYYPLKDWLGTIQQKLEHTIKFQFKDERIRITFTNLVVYTVPFECIVEQCKGGMKYPKKTRAEHIRQLFIVWNGLQETILNKLDKANNETW